MKTIVLLHTTKATLETYPKQIEKALNFPVRIFNMYDDYFATVDIAMPRKEKDDMRLRRLRCFLEAAELMHPDVIVVACSTISVEANRLRSSFSVPVLPMDDAMLEAASESDGRILVFATSPNPISPVTERLKTCAKRKHRNIEIEVSLCERALPYLLNNNREAYKKEVLEHIRHMPKADRIVLAQGSTASLQAEIEAACGCPVYSSPMYLYRQLQELLHE